MVPKAQLEFKVLLVQKEKLELKALMVEKVSRGQLDLRVFKDQLDLRVFKGQLDLRVIMAYRAQLDLKELVELKVPLVFRDRRVKLV